ncbi:MAG: stage III sporulation protein AE [Clostridia bacterium]|nr:stage III sporulation protein AE [Clostridia bacterium]
MRKLAILVLVVALYLLICPVGARAQEQTEIDPNKILDAQMEKIELSDLQEFIDQIDRDVGQYVPEISIRKFIDSLREGKIDFSFGSLLRGLGEFLFHELIKHSALMGKLVILAVICAVLYNLLDAFEGTTGQVAYTIVYLVLIAIAIGSFTEAIKIGRESIDKMVSFVQTLLPLLLTLLASIGGVSSAALMHPFIMAALGLLGTLIKNFVFPLIYFSGILGIISHINKKIKISNFAALLKDIGVASLGIFLTLFVGFLGLQGIAGVVVDSVTLKTAKFMTGTFVPVVGKMMADALEVIVGTSLLLKNAVGLIGVIILIVLCAFPVIKIISLVIIYRLAAALVQPIGESGVSDALQTMGNALTLVFAAVAGVGLMFFIAIGVVVGVGNFNVMLR